MTTNCIKFTSADIETAKGVGSISTLTFDLDITVEPVASVNPMAPTHRVLGRSPRGKLVECGGIWKKQNKETGADYYTLTIRDHGFNANLGKAANQNDLSLHCRPSSLGGRKTLRDVKNRLGQPSRFPLFPFALKRIPHILEPVVGPLGGSNRSLNWRKVMMMQSASEETGS